MLNLNRFIKPNNILTGSSISTYEKRRLFINEEEFDIFAKPINNIIDKMLKIITEDLTNVENNTKEIETLMDSINAIYDEIIAKRNKETIDKITIIKDTLTNFVTNYKNELSDNLSNLASAESIRKLVEDKLYNEIAERKAELRNLNNGDSVEKETVLFKKNGNEFLYVDEDGRLFAYGENENHTLGIGLIDSKRNFTEIKKIKDAGGNFIDEFEVTAIISLTETSSSIKAKINGVEKTFNIDTDGYFKATA